MSLLIEDDLQFFAYLEISNKIATKLNLYFKNILNELHDFSS